MQSRGGSANVAGDASLFVGDKDEKAAQTVYLNGSSGSDTSDGSEAAPVKTLPKALELAGEDGTIIVTGSVDVTEDVDVSNVTIRRGEGFAWPGSTMLRVNGAEVTLTNVTLDGMNYMGSGSGGFVGNLLAVQNGGRVSIEGDTQIINNTDTAVRVTTNATLTMNDGLISNNHSGDYSDGGAINVDQGFVYLKGGEISGNSSERCAGGVMVGGHGGYVELNGTIIKNNSATLHGGGVFVQGFKRNGNVNTGSATFVMKSGEISGNTCGTGYMGGGIATTYAGYETTIDIQGGTIADNTCADGEQSGSAIALTVGSNYQGSSTLKLSDSPTIKGTVLVRTPSAPIQVTDSFTPTSPVELVSNSLTVGKSVVTFAQGLKPDASSFSSAHEGWGLLVNGQDLQWAQLCQVTFASADGTQTYDSTYASATGLIDPATAPTPTQTGYTLAGWRLEGASGNELWNFSTDTVTEASATLLAVWELDAPTASLSADRTEVHEDSDNTFTLTATATHALGNARLNYTWYRDGSVIDSATGPTLSTSTPGSYTVAVSATDGTLVSSAAESNAVTCTVTPHEAEAWSADATGHWRTCTVCQSPFDAEPHQWGAWTTTREPNAAEKGERRRACSTCGFVAVETFTATEADNSSNGSPADATGADKNDLPKTGSAALIAVAPLALTGMGLLAARAILRRRAQ